MVASKARAAEVLASQRFLAVVSIGDPGQDTPRGLEAHDRVLRLEFDDVLLPSDDAHPPTLEHVQRVLALGRELASAEGEVLVHCAKGQSRSVALGIALTSLWLGPGHEREAVARVFAIASRPWASPLIIDLADTALARDGELRLAFERALTQEGT